MIKGQFVHTESSFQVVWVHALTSWKLPYGEKVTNIAIKNIVFDDVTCQLYHFFPVYRDTAGEIVICVLCSQSQMQDFLFQTFCLAHDWDLFALISCHPLLYFRAKQAWTIAQTFRLAASKIHSAKHWTLTWPLKKCTTAVSYNYIFRLNF